MAASNMDSGKPQKNSRQGLSIIFSDRFTLQIVLYPAECIQGVCLVAEGTVYEMEHHDLIPRERRSSSVAEDVSMSKGDVSVEVFQDCIFIPQGLLALKNY